MITGKKALIFDLDGTVADTIWAIREAVNTARRQLGLGELSYDEVKAGVNNGARRLVIVTIVDEEHKNDEEYIERALELYTTACRSCFDLTTEPYDGMREALCELKSRGYRIGMLSNKPNEFVRPIADRLFGEGFFEVARGPVGNALRKPDPALTLELLAELDPTLRPEDCVMIGDSDVDIMTGRNVGMTTVGVAWGYRGREFLEKTGADAVVDRPDELCDILE